LTDKHQKVNLPPVLFLVAVLFLVRGILSFDRYAGGPPYMGYVAAVVFFAGFLGLVSGRMFGLVVVSVTAGLDLLLSVSALTHDFTYFFAVIFNLFIISILLFYRRVFKPPKPFDGHILIVLFLLVSAFIFNMLYQMSRPKEHEKYAPTITRAIQEKNVSICYEVGNIGYIGECIKSVNVELRDPRLCELIERQDIKDLCYYGLAKHYKNISFCDKIVGLNKQFCYEYAERRGWR